MNQHQLGYRAASEAITSGADLPAMLTTLSDYTQATVDLFAGAISCVLATFICLRNAKLVKPHADTDTEQFLQSPSAMMAVTLQRDLVAHASGEATAVAYRLRAMCESITQHRSKISFNAPAVVEPPAPAEPPIQRFELVNIADMPTATTMTITALPKRLTTSEVSRDADGNIISANNIEQDIAA